MPLLNPQATPNTGDVFTIAFKPTGIGNPFDNGSDWYQYVANANLPVTVQGVALNGLVVTEEVDVTMQYNGNPGNYTYGMIGDAITVAATGLLTNYEWVGIQSGSASQLPNSSTTGNLAAGLPNTAIWAIVGLVALAIVIPILKKEV